VAPQFLDEYVLLGYNNSQDRRLADSPATVKSMAADPGGFHPQQYTKTAEINTLQQAKK
jgi:hypothetical protein